MQIYAAARYVAQNSRLRRQAITVELWLRKLPCTNLIAAFVCALCTKTNIVYMTFAAYIIYANIAGFFSIK